MLIEKPVDQLLAAFASPAPTPAGGSAAALASAIGASLLRMGASLPRARLPHEDTIVLVDASSTLATLQELLAGAVDADADAYAAVLGSSGAARQAAIRTATDVPVRVMQCSLAALILAPAVAVRCRRTATSDVRVAIDLLSAGFAGAKSSATDNLRIFDDAAAAAAVLAEIGNLSERTAAALESARAVAQSS